MKWTAAFLLALLSTGAGAYWQSRDQNAVSVAAAYSGPGDVVSGALAWWGLRAYSAAVAGTPALNLCLPGDTTCADVSTDSSTGNLTIPGSLSTCSIVTCTVKILYDQSGALKCTAAACDLTQATEGNRATFVYNATASGKYCLQFAAGSAQKYQTLLFDGTAQPNTVSVVANRPGTSGSPTFAGNTNSHDVYFVNGSANTVQLYAGASLNATAADAAYHAMQMTFNGVSSEAYIDGSAAASPDAGSAAIASALFLGQDQFGQLMTGFICEAGVWHGAFSSGNKSGMNSNQHSYGGF